jgi:rhodanese-related sulfurtransferase
LVNDAKSHVKQVNIDQYRQMPREGHILIDVREDREWADGHAAGAVHLGKGVIERDIEKDIPDKSTTLVLYCGGGFRSALAAEAIQKMGYTNAISLDGGWRAWNQAGLPVEKP